MKREIISLRIKAEKLGTVSEVTTLLNDLEFVYNSIYSFDFFVETIRRERIYKKDKKPFFRLKEYYKNTLPNLINFQNEIDISSIVLPSDKLYISKVNIQSPGFWEVLGVLNPLQHIKEYLQDRHERKKDKQYRSRQEEELGELEISERKNQILNQQIEILKTAGYSDLEIRQFVTKMVLEPLNRLGKLQDIGQIEAPDE